MPASQKSPSSKELQRVNQAETPRKSNQNTKSQNKGSNPHTIKLKFHTVRK